MHIFLEKKCFLQCGTQRLADFNSRNIQQTRSNDFLKCENFHLRVSQNIEN